MIGKAVALSSVTAVAFAVSTAIDAWRAYAGSILWAWFAVPLGLPSLSLWHVWGFVLIGGVAFDRGRSPRKEKPTQSELGEAVGYAVLGPAMSLAIGWALATLGGLR